MRDETTAITAGRDPHANHGVVNPPVHHASTILFPTLEALEAASRDFTVGYSYGRHGVPVTRALEDAVAALDGGYKAVAASSGVAAMTMAVLAFVKAGDHVLCSDNCYDPTRVLCSNTLARLGVSCDFFHPSVGADIVTAMKPNTSLVVTEAPGSLTFEMTDIPAITAAAKGRGAAVIMDNTWATSLFFKPLAHGVDVSVQAATKYIVGHSDAMAGVATATEAAWPHLRRAARELGACLAPDDCYLALRGLRTMPVRLAQHQQTALRLAQWLKTRPEVLQVMHPALPEDPGHALWRRDFSGASGLFGFVLRPGPKAALAAFLDNLDLYGMGYSWGGFESLILPVDPAKRRTVAPWTTEGWTLRVHAGLEHGDDLLADLEAGLNRYVAAGGSCL